MPNRIIKESICTDTALSRVSAGAERLYHRLTVKADDYGIFYANPRILSSLCFPINLPSEEEIIRWLDELRENRLILCCRGIDNENYLKILQWEKNQRTRAKISKFEVVREQMECAGAVCGQMRSNDGPNDNVFGNGNVNDNECDNVNGNVVGSRMTAPVENEQAVEKSDPLCEVIHNAYLRGRFLQFWEKYPKKTGKLAAAGVFIGEGHGGGGFSGLMAYLEQQKASPQWQEQDGRSIPTAEHFLRNPLWEGAPPGMGGNQTNTVPCTRGKRR